MTAQEIPTSEQHEEHVTELEGLLRQLSDIGNEKVPIGSDMSEKLDRVNRGLAVAGKITESSDVYAKRFGVIPEEMAFEAAMDRLYGEGN